MSNKRGDVRRMTLRLYTREVVEVIDRIPAGYRSALIEQALLRFLDSEEGKAAVRVLKGRANGSDKIEQPAGGRLSLLKQLNGDFQ